MSILSSLAGRAVGLAANVAGPWRLYAELAAAGVLVTALGAQTWRLHSEEAKSAKAEATLANERAAAEKAARVATEAARAEESRRAVAQKEIVDESQRMSSRNRSDAVAAGDAHVRLLERATAAARGGGAPLDSQSAIGGAPAVGAGLLLADVLSRSDTRSGQLAAYADEARTAGQACERAYDSLTAKAASAP